jgi:hypothetical protein
LNAVGAGDAHRCKAPPAPPSEDATPPNHHRPGGVRVSAVLAVIPTRRVAAFERDAPEDGLRGFVVGNFTCAEADESRRFAELYDLLRYGHSL